MARPKSDLAPRILEAARLRFLSDGVDGASLRGIASDAGSNIGMIYYYYPTKDDLFLAVIEAVYQPFLEEITVLISGDDSPQQRIARVYARVAAMNDLEFDVIRLVIRESLISSDRMRRVADRIGGGHLPLILTALAEGRASGEFDDKLSMQLEAASIFALGVIPQLLMRLARNAGLPSAASLPGSDEAVKEQLHILLHGIAGPVGKSDKTS